MNTHEEGQLTPEQLQIATEAAKTGDITGWGVLGDSLAESDFPHSGAVLSRVAERDPHAHILRPAAYGDDPEGSFRHTTVRDGSDLVHWLQVRLNGLWHGFSHRVRKGKRDMKRIAQAVRKYAEGPGDWENHDQFLRAIVADPTNRYIALVYADWLQDHGHDEAAHIIRQHVEQTGNAGRVVPVQTPTGRLKNFRVNGNRLMSLSHTGGFQPGIRLMRDVGGITHVHPPGVSVPVKAPSATVEWEAPTTQAEGTQLATGLFSKGAEAHPGSFWQPRWMGNQGMYTDPEARIPYNPPRHHSGEIPGNEPPSQLSRISRAVRRFARPNPIKGGKGDRLQPSQVNASQLKKGIAIEKEHSPKRNIAQDIALDHLAETPDYYDKLEKIEEPVKHEAWRAPAGGVIARGIYTPGGEFMPDMEGQFMNPPEKKIKLDAHKHAQIREKLKATYKPKIKRKIVSNTASSNGSSMARCARAVGVVKKAAYRNPPGVPPEPPEEPILHEPHQPEPYGDSDRRLWVMNHEPLYRMWQATIGPEVDRNFADPLEDGFIENNRDAIDAVIRGQPGMENFPHQMKRVAMAVHKVKRYSRPLPEEHQAFHNKIAENMDEKTAPLVYADWLEEHDMPQLAAYIREVIRLQGSYSDPNRIGRVMVYNYNPRPEDAAQAHNTVFAYQGLGAYRERTRGRKRPPETIRIDVKNPYSPDYPAPDYEKDKEKKGGYLSFGLDVPLNEAHEWMRRLISEGHPVGNAERSSVLRRAAAAATQRPSESPEQLSRITSTVRKFAAHSSDLAALFKAVRENPYDNTLHGVIADAIEELLPNSPLPELIRKQYGMGQYQGQGEQDLLWHEPLYNSYDGTHPYAAHLGRHGPFNLYLLHEGTPEVQGGNQRWVLRVASNMPGSRDTAYNFEFPHEETEHLMRMFPGVRNAISPTTVGTDDPDVLAQHFDDLMDEQERNRE